MQMEIIFLIGRIFFGGYFLFSGLNHFTKMNMMSGFAASKGVPMPTFMVAVGGVLLLLGGAGMLFGVYIQWAVIALVLFFVPVTIKMHAFWKDSDPQSRMMNMTLCLRNIALLGASLMTLSIPTPWIWSIF